MSTEWTNAFKIGIDEPTGNIYLGRTTSRWEGNVTRDIKNGYQYEELDLFGQDRK